MKRLFVLIGLLCFAAVMWAQEAPDTVITQGRMSVKIVKVMKAKLPEGVSEQDAVSFLETLGMKPSEGWNITKPLNGKTLSDLLVIVGGQISSIQPNALITAIRADQVLQRNANMFRKYYLTKYSSDHKTESEILDEGALRGVPMSPSQTK